MKLSDIDKASIVKQIIIKAGKELILATAFNANATGQRAGMLNNLSVSASDKPRKRDTIEQFGVTFWDDGQFVAFPETD